MSKDNKEKNWFARHKILTVILVVFLLGVIGSSMGGNKTSITNTPTSSSDTTTKTPETKNPDVPAEYTSALNQAKSYAKNMNMSKQAVYDQLVAPMGGKFSEAAAQYAIDNIQVDWNANALAKAKTYQKGMSVSPAAIHDQLTSSAGEKFTEAEADYAIQHLND